MAGACGNCLVEAFGSALYVFCLRLGSASKVQSRIGGPKPEGRPPLLTNGPQMTTEPVPGPIPRWHIHVLLVLALGCLCMRSVWWQTDLHRDMAYYGYTAQVILRGGLPFRDVDTDKPVLLYYWLAPFLQIFGIASPLGVHVAASLCVAATIIPLYFAGRHLDRPSV